MFNHYCKLVAPLACLVFRQFTPLYVLAVNVKHNGSSVQYLVYTLHAPVQDCWFVSQKTATYSKEITELKDVLQQNQTCLDKANVELESALERENTLQEQTKTLSQELRALKTDSRKEIIQLKVMM